MAIQYLAGFAKSDDVDQDQDKEKNKIFLMLEIKIKDILENDNKNLNLIDRCFLKNDYQLLSCILKGIFE